MSQTQTPHEPQGPRVTAEQVRDVRRLRRSRSDRQIAGVAGGLARHLDVDPTVVRVLLVVLAFFGGAGLVVYGAVWLLVPEDGQEHAPVNVGSDLQKALLIAAAVIAGLVFLGTTFGDNRWYWGLPVPVLLLALVAIAVLATRDRRPPSTPPPPWRPATPEPAEEGTTMSVSAPPPSAYSSPTPPSYTTPPPPAYTPAPPPKPQRTGPVLFWPTLALIAIGMGVLGIVDSRYDVAISAYPALALGITGVVLVIGAFVARPGGLIALGLVLALATGITGIAQAATGNGVSSVNRSIAPASATELGDSYRVDRGETVLDLTGVTDLAALDGRSVNVRSYAGRIDVIVPQGLNARVDANISYAGQIIVDDTTRGGIGTSLEQTLVTSTAPNAPVIDLELDLRVGEIQVERG